jgi:hypothetical protein
MIEMPKITLQDVLTEKGLCDLLGMSSEQIADLRRNKGLPFIKVNQQKRLYFESDIIEFFRQNRIILNQGSGTESN